MMKTRNLLLGLLLTSFSLAGKAQNFEWTKNIGGTPYSADPSLNIDEYGNVYQTGFFEGTVDFDPGPSTYNLTSIGLSDIFIAKFNTKGDFIWATQVIREKYDNMVFSIAVDALQNVYINGTFRDTMSLNLAQGPIELISAGEIDVFVAKLDASGSMVWAKRMGGSGVDFSQVVGVDKSGNVFTSGFFAGTTDFDPGINTFNLTSDSGFGVFVSKLDASGNFVWAKSFSGKKGIIGLDMAVDAIGNVFTTGMFEGTIDFNPDNGTHNLSADVEGNAAFISKLDSSGNFVWAKHFSGKSSGLQATNIILDNNGNVYSSGKFLGTFDFDPGAGIRNLSSDNGRAYISKLDASGNFVWAKQISGNIGDKGFFMTVDDSRNLYLCNSFFDTVDFDPGPGNFKLTSPKSWNACIFKLDASGNFAWAKQIGDTGSVAFCKAIKTDKSGNIYTSGLFYGSVDFNPGPDTFKLTTTNSYNTFILKLSQPTLGLEEENLQHNLSAFPNPTNGSFTLTCKEPFNNPTLTVRNYLGQEVFRKSYASTDRIELTLDVPAGIYIAELVDRGQKGTLKIIKQ